jgi:uncharacterized coiled-coil protein SlyX
MSRPLPRIRHADPPTGDLVSGWLDVFLTLLRLPGDQADPIREELESHLRDRARDLMLTGLNEAEATRQAITELGEAADVAARYRALKSEPRRRLLMHLTLFGVGAALAMSVAAFSLSGRQQPPAAASTQEATIAQLNKTVREQEDRLAALSDQVQEQRRLAADLQAARSSPPQITSAAYEPTPPDPALAALVIDATFQNSRLEDVFKGLGTATNASVDVKWPLIQPNGATPSSAINLRKASTTVPRILAQVSEQLNLQGSQSLDARLRDGVLTIATREYFDKAESTLVAYDVSGIVQARMVAYSEGREVVIKDIVDVVTHFVSPDDWNENGGNLAQTMIVGDRLFIKAPARFHPQIQWILDQLPAMPAPHSLAPAQDRNTTLVSLTRQRDDVKDALALATKGANQSQIDALQAQLDKIEAELKQLRDQQAAPVPQSTRTFMLRNSNAARVAAVLAPHFPNSQISVDQRTNTIIVTGPVDAISGVIQGLDENPGASDVRRFAIKHVSADAALKALESRPSIRAIDFSKFSTDAATNSIIGLASAPDLDKVTQALLDIDLPAPKP